MRKLYILIFIANLLTSCGKYYYLTSKFSLETDSLQTSSIPLNATYQLYIRHVYKSSKGTLKTFKTNLSQASKGNDTLIEVEYLLISNLLKNAIYISTIADKYQQYFAQHYLGDSVINLYDLKKICLGKIEGDSIFFASKNNKDLDVWTMNRLSGQPNFIMIQRIEEEINHVYEQSMRVDKALEEPIAFEKVGQPYIVKFYHQNDPMQSIALLKSNKIYFHQKKNKYEFFFKMDRLVRKSNSDRIYFGDDRLVYYPQPLYESDQPQER